MYKNLCGVSDTAHSDKVYVIKAGSRNEPYSIILRLGPSKTI